MGVPKYPITSIASTPLVLSSQMVLNLLLEEQLPQAAMRGLAQGLGLHTHLVLIRSQLIRTVLLMPEVKKATRGWANHHELAVKILPVQMHVLQSPAFDAPIEPTWKQVNNVLVRVHRHVTINNRLSHIRYLCWGNQIGTGMSYQNQSPSRILCLFVSPVWNDNV